MTKPVYVRSRFPVLTGSKEKDEGKSMDAEHQSKMTLSDPETDLMQMSNGIFLDTKASLADKKTMRVPIAELATLGAGISALIPSLNTVTQTAMANGQGLYRLVNAGTGDVLKTAKDGNFWGAMKTQGGASKLAKFQKADPDITTALPNPATVMMAVALFQIEKELVSIEETQKSIIRFLEIENEAGAEADLETLVGIMKNFKLIWDSEKFVLSNHKLVLDIQRAARKNMNVYQKKANAAIEKKETITAQRRVNAKLEGLQKTFQYYRLALYTFSLASFLEILLSGNYKEEYISNAQAEIRLHSETYRNCFERCSVFLEKVSNSTIGVNVKKGIGTASKALGKAMENVPVISKGSVDEFLQSRGEHMNEHTSKTERAVVRAFAAVGNPGTGMLLRQMDDMIQIYDHTTQICFDDKNIYLIADR